MWGLHHFFGTWELAGAMDSDRRGLFFVTLSFLFSVLFPRLLIGGWPVQTLRDLRER